MDCVVCKAEIPPQRLKILPNTRVCVKCSNVQPRVGIMRTEGTGDNTYQVTEILSSKDVKFTASEDPFRDSELEE